MADLSGVGDWVGKHPYATGAIVFGGGLALLWMFGFFSGGSSQQSSGGSAAAFYQAEAAQSQAGAAIQLGTLQTAAATAQAKINADTASAIATTQAGMAVTINGQNTGSANTIAGYDAQTSQLATASNNATVLAQTISNNQTQQAIDYAHTDASVLQTAMNTVIPQELALSQGFANVALPGFGTAGVYTGGATSINDLLALGYPLDAAQKLAYQRSGI